MPLICCLLFITLLVLCNVWYIHYPLVHKMSVLQVVMVIVIQCKILKCTVVLNEVIESSRSTVILFADF